MNTTTTQDSGFFAPGYLQRLAQTVNGDPMVARHSTLARLRIGMRNTDTGECAWLAVEAGQVTAGSGEREVQFWLEGDRATFDDLQRGVPFNRLFRQHRLAISGDLRGCVQNWLLIYAITRLTAQLEP